MSLPKNLYTESKTFQKPGTFFSAPEVFHL